MRRKVPSVKESKLGINLLLEYREKERKGNRVHSEFKLKNKTKQHCMVQVPQSAVLREMGTELFRSLNLQHSHCWSR